MPELLVYGLIVVAMAGFGVAIGMLLAPRVQRLGDRLAAPDDEGDDGARGEPGDRPPDR